VHVCAIKAYRGSIGIAPVIFDLSTRWKCIRRCTSWGKSSSRCWVGAWWADRANLDILQKRKSLAVAGFAPSTVWSQYQLSYPGFLLKIIKNKKKKLLFFFGNKMGHT